MTDAEIKRFIRDRDKTFTAAVINDDWDAVKRYSLRWGIKIPSNENVMKAGIYKAVQECTKIPKEVKDIAREKCVALGFKPTIWEG